MIGSGGTHISIVHSKINSLGIRHQETPRFLMLQVGASQSRERRDYSLYADNTGLVADRLVVDNHVAAL